MRHVRPRALLRLLRLLLLKVLLLAPAPRVSQSFESHPLSRRESVWIGKARPGFAQRVEAHHVCDQRGKVRRNAAAFFARTSLAVRLAERFKLLEE
jgi:hypothetical protein